ncbi:unnamed protein product [Allacma fusca]|uniref:Uncharacterized protein n=1 Tax=Allacma fusca TaxID=39272 RepID=A0A8J2LIC2_9HEXA|nr:unnamed protein product [Allacma fusca]
MLKLFTFTVVLANLMLAQGFRYSDAQKTLKTLREKSSLFEEGSNSTMLLSECNYDRGDLKRIILSATRAMDFFEHYLSNLVLDAAIGTRLMESQLLLFQAGHPKLPQTLQMYLMTLQFKSELLSEEIIDRFTDLLQTDKLTNPERTRLVQTLNWVYNASLWESPSVGSWHVPNDQPLSATNKSAETLDEKLEIMTEETSDECIGGIFQVLFYLIAKKQNCFANQQFKLKTANNTEPTEFLHLMCDKVWEEANMIENSGYPVKFRDLLAEQITVCSLAGYSHFLKRSWLENILSWQNQEDSVGCFLDMRRPEPSVEPSEDIKSILEVIQKARRIKRSDNLVRLGAHDCSVHFTAVCMGALAMHLRYFGDTCLRNY